MILSACDVVKLDSLKTPLVNKFYDACRAKGRAKKHDEVWVVYFQGQIIAACRIQLIEGERFLSTVMVEKAYRSQGLARFFVHSVLSVQDVPLYTFAYDYLQHFYASLGFCLVGRLPPPLASRFIQYQKKQSHLLAMKFVP